MKQSCFVSRASCYYRVMHSKSPSSKAPEKREAFHARIIGAEGMLLDCAERLAPDHALKIPLLDACGVTTRHALYAIYMCGNPERMDS
jgi:hypothetical protein